MPPVPTVQPDGPKIRKLIELRGYSVTDFARRLGRHPQSIWVITGRADRPVASKKFIRQIARELGVSVRDISDWTDDDPFEPEALASLDAEKPPPRERRGQGRERNPPPSITTSKGENPE